MSDTNQLAQRDDQQQAVSRRDGEAVRPVKVTPAVDVYENKQGITLWADLPGVSKDKLEINVHDGRLSIEAEAVVSMPAALRVQHVEMREPRFARTFTLSPDLDTSKVEAELRDGVLKLTIPRREEAQPRRIEVKTS
ncbi:HSP20 family molecular chaperone IbpA [Trinickia symbiotica]|uniref:Hsp20/alpha crystallin family protein n=1 Tax=Trinickia symbiotica TaxID=863227 RepID=A0A2N7XAA8_9BURK|nr:Hsp20/alpha crystallin family protein [Trinickia symbiotica]PMS38699.1 Hsp20/alpha crystallin family protein [Trinickia symbiotica]PPK46723.1 HSP20 family molecular chaperone IbpA [Trinickia symbiotica]